MNKEHRTRELLVNSTKSLKDMKQYLNKSNPRTNRNYHTIKLNNPKHI